MGLFRKKGRNIIRNDKMIKDGRTFSDDEIGRLQYKTNLLIKVSKGVTLAVMLALAVYIFVYDRTIFTGGRMSKEFIPAIIAIIILGVGANGITYYLIAKRMEGSYWTAYRQQYLINMASETKGIDYVVYREEPGLAIEEIEASVLVLCKYYKLCTSQDSLSGEMGGDSFRLANFKAGVPKRKENGKMGEKRIFSGILGMIWNDEENPLKKYGFMQVFSKEYKPSVAGFTAQHKIESGNEAFDNNFDIYAERPNMLRTFFTEEFTEAVENFAKTLGTPVALSFNGGRMFIAINKYPDIFEAKLDVNVLKQKEEIKRLMEGVAAAKKIYDAAKGYVNV